MAAEAVLGVRGYMLHYRTILKLCMSALFVLVMSGTINSEAFVIPTITAIPGHNFPHIPM
ncbi:MAG: hypothetical protein WBF33_13260 [Candidatus Nitrosopolaris sp.]